MSNDYMYKAAVAEIALFMFEIICQERDEDQTQTLVAALESGEFKGRHMKRILEIDGMCEQAVERFGVTAKELEDDIALALHQYDVIMSADKLTSFNIH